MSAPTKMIGGRQFAFGMMPADVATEVEVTIAGVASEAIVKVIAGQGGSETAQAEAAASAIGSLAVALGRLGPNKTTELMRTVFTYTSVMDGDKGRPVDLVADFTGKSKEKWAVLFEALKVNLGDFFPAGLSLSPVVPPPK